MLLDRLHSLHHVLGQLFERDRAVAVLVDGPIPGEEAPKAVWTSVKGAKLRTTRDQFLDIEGQVAPGQDFAARVVAIATKFAFGDLGLLRQGGDF